MRSFILGLLFASTAIGQNLITQAPLYANNGYPDLAIDSSLVKDWDVVDRYFSPAACELVENTIQATGTRRLLRFTTAAANRGSSFSIGQPSDLTNPYYPYFEFSACHGHYHFTGFTRYELLDSKGVVLLQARKEAFCLEDILAYRDAPNKQWFYECHFDYTTQGVSSGWADIYDKTISGQWLDVTGLPGGSYLLRVTLNPAGLIPEGANKYANVLDIKVQIPAPNRAVRVMTCGDRDLWCE